MRAGMRSHAGLRAREGKPGVGLVPAWRNRRAAVAPGAQGHRDRATEGRLVVTDRSGDGGVGAVGTGAPVAATDWDSTEPWPNTWAATASSVSSTSSMVTSSPRRAATSPETRDAAGHDVAEHGQVHLALSATPWEVRPPTGSDSVRAVAPRWRDLAGTTLADAEPDARVAPRRPTPPQRSLRRGIRGLRSRRLRDGAHGLARRRGRPRR